MARYGEVSSLGLLPQTACGMKLGLLIDLARV